MPVVSTGLTVPGIRGEFFNRYDEVKTFYQDLVTVLPSNTKTEVYKFLGSVPPMRPWGTGRLAKGMYTESYSVSAEKYESTIEVDRDEISDDQLGQIRLRVHQMAERAATHKDYLLAQLLINGATAGFHSYDGVPFFSANHVSGEQSAQDNTQSLAIVDKDDATVAEFKTALRKAIALLLGSKDDQGQPMSLTADGLACIVPPSLYVNALEAVNATVIGSTTNVLQGASRIIAFPWLTAADKWYLLKTDSAIRPFVFQDREKAEWTAKEGDSDEGFLREKYLYGVRARYKLTYGYWQYAVQTTFTTAA